MRFLLPRGEKDRETTGLEQVVFLPWVPAQNHEPLQGAAMWHSKS